MNDKIKCNIITYHANNCPLFKQSIKKICPKSTKSNKYIIFYTKVTYFDCLTLQFFVYVYVFVV